MQRQFRNAFQCFTVFQSYQAWVILRPSIESALIMGKWLDDIENVEIWKEHKGDWQKYNKIYSGKSLASKSLPQSSRIQQVLKVINDDYMHVNPVYYFNNTGLQQMGADNIIFIPFFDEEIEHKSHLYSFLHLTLLVIKSIAEMLAPYFHQHDELRIDLVRLQIAFKNRVAAIVKENPEQLLVLRELGLWPNNLFEQSAVI
jgi:hypothetical protein